MPPPAQPRPPSDTSSAWLQRLRARDATTWRTLARDYGPLLYAWCRRLGLPAGETGDVIQDVLHTVTAAFDTFVHQGPGSFRAWLRAVTRSRVIDHFRRRRNQPQGIGGSDAQQQFNEIPEPNLEQDEASEQALVLCAVLERLRGEFSEPTWQAFWRLIIDGHSSADIGGDLGLSPDAVRQAKARVLRRLRDELAEHSDGEA